MAKRFKLREIEKARGKPLDRIIPPLVNRYGQAGAAQRLGVTQSAISNWLKDNNYVSSITWQKGETPQEKADIDAVVAQVNAERRAAGLPTIEEEEAAEWDSRPLTVGQGEKS